MTHPWTVDPNDPFTVPNTAGPGQARIVIGTVLPPALTGYTFTEIFNGGTFEYGGAIIFYPNSVPPVDQNYTYVATTKQTAGADTLVWHVGTVVNGAVVEAAPGQPEVLQFSESIVGTAADGRILEGGRILISAIQAAIEMSANTDFILNAANNVQINATALDFTVNAGTNASITGINSASLIGGTSGSAVQADGNGVVISALGAGDDINFIAAGDIQVQGVRAFLVTDQQTANATALQALAVAPVNMPGCLINVNTVTTNAKYSAQIVCDFDETALGNTVCVGTLLVDGVAQAAQALLEVAAVTDRGTVTQSYSGTLAVAGAHTFQMQVNKVAAVGAMVANAIHTTISVTIMESGG